VTEQGMTGIENSTLLARVEEEDRALLTMDKGIADVRAYPPARFGGLILFRPGRTGRGAVLAFVRRCLPRLLGIDLKGRLLVITERGIRIR
jgi:hypothetical protein